MIKTGYQVIYKCDENPPWRSPEITLLPRDGEVVARYFVLHQKKLVMLITGSMILRIVFK